jgi:hypothetical protein
MDAHLALMDDSVPPPDTEEDRKRIAGIPSAAEAGADISRLRARGEPKPCPFCGRRPRHYEFHHGFIKWDRVECSFCGIVMSVPEQTPVVAIAAWNGRGKNGN